MKKQTVFLSIALLTIGTILNASRFYSIISVNGNHIRGMNGTAVLQECFPMVQQSSSHGSGWGLAYYINGEFGDPFFHSQSGQYFEGPLWRSSNRANTESQMINNIFNQIRFVDNSTPISAFIGHIRKASSGCGSTGGGDATDLENPHPFIQELPDGKTYSFAHNGTLNKDVLRALITDPWIIENGFIPQTYEDTNGCGGDWQTDGWDNVIDSELFFFWIIKNIMEDPARDVTRGMQKALNHETFRVMDANKNFVLTDGESIWSFRRAKSDDYENYGDDPDLLHTVYWKYVNEGDTQYAAAISQKGDPDDNTWHLLSNRALVFLPGEGKPVVIENFDNLDGIELKRLHKGTNWVGFPILENNTGTPIQSVVEYLINTNINITPLVDLTIQSQSALSSWDYYNDWQQLNLTTIESVEGYKLTLTDDVFKTIYMPVQGNRISVDTEVTLQTGLNWISYFPTNNLAPSIALPQEVRDNLKSIRGENWFMTCKNSEFYVKGECLVTEDVYAECYTLVYGDMYILDMSAPVTFQWNTSPFNQNPITPEEPQSFSAVKTEDYIPVVIDTIESAETIIEIGAIKDGIVVGAEVVNGYPVNFKLYSNNLEGVSFEVLTTPNGSARKSDELKLQPKKEIFDRGVVFMTLSPASSKPTTVPETISLVQAYPNPFNPTVIIRFNILDQVDISLVIYDITGNRIKTLLDGNLNTGSHAITWDGTNEYNNPVATGIYLYQLQTPDALIKNKIIYLK